MSPCDGAQCDNGECVPGNNDYNCSCPKNFIDKKCSTEVNYCLSSPCQFGTCVNQIDGHICEECPSVNFYGITLSDDMKKCGEIVYFFQKYK